MRLTSPGGIDVRQAAYWQPKVGEKNGPLQVLLRTRDYNKREEGEPDPQRVAVLDLASGSTSKLDEAIEGLPIEFAISANHRYAVVALLEPSGEGNSYSLEAIDLRAYGYGEAPKELLPQPSVVPWQVLDNGDVVCRIVRAVLLEKGLPAVGIEWSKEAQLCNINNKRFSNAGTVPLPSQNAELRAGYSVAYDTALPDKARMTYALGDSVSGARSWEMDYFGGSAPFDWRPTVRWISAGSAATVAFRRGALEGEAGLFRIVALERSGSARLIEDRVTADTSLVATPGVLLYAMRSGGATWSIWAASPDGLQKQRVMLVEDTVFLELLDIVDGRRVLAHRQYFGNEQPAQLHSEVFELSLDPLQATKGNKTTDEELKPLPSSKAVVEEGDPSPRHEQSNSEETPPEDLFPSGPGDGGGFLPDNPGDGPPPIAEP
ncbi:MAG: hypothetical protein M3R04_00485 [bacterium]|nr:hypothetical protein [bacterium]